MVVADISSDNVTYKEEWNALQKVIEEYLSEFRQRDFNLVLCFDLCFPPRELYAECAEIVRNAPADPNADYDNMLDEMLDEYGLRIKLSFDQDLVDELGYTRLAEAYVDAREGMG